MSERVAEYREIWRRAAADAGVEFVELAESFWELHGKSGQSVARLHNYVVSLDDPVTLDIAGDKVLTYRLFEAAGLTLTPYRPFGFATLDSIDGFMRDNPPPYVVKPARNTSSGLGVSTNLYTRAACLRAAALALSYCDEALIERQVAGESYRLLFLGHEMICASRRTGLRVSGDGRRSLRRLLRDEHGSTCDWDRDADVRATLGIQGLGLDTVPEPGVVVLARSTASEPGATRHEEVRTVYTEDVTDHVCEAVVAEGRAASLALQSEFCGVDVITVDPGRPLGDCKGAVNEINTTPGLHHHYLSERAGAPIAARVVRYMLDRAARGSVPQ